VRAASVSGPTTEYRAHAELDPAKQRKGRRRAGSQEGGHRSARRPCQVRCVSPRRGDGSSGMRRLKRVAAAPASGQGHQRRCGDLLITPGHRPRYDRGARRRYCGPRRALPRRDRAAPRAGAAGQSQKACRGPLRDRPAPSGPKTDRHGPHAEKHTPRPPSSALPARPRGLSAERGSRGREPPSDRTADRTRVRSLRSPRGPVVGVQPGHT
jgi:hypothetical protein